MLHLRNRVYLTKAKKEKPHYLMLAPCTKAMTTRKDLGPSYKRSAENYRVNNHRTLMSIQT
jgi:hypothetical protein